MIGAEGRRAAMLGRLSYLASVRALFISLS
jgi:hypothetical protein